jgi:hypothetical protein
MALKYGSVPEKVKNWYREIYPNQKFDFKSHKYGVSKEHRLNKNLRSIYQNYRTIPGYFPQLISNQRTLDSIKTWFDKAIKKGPVSYTNLQNKFPAQATATLQKALGKDFQKLVIHTPVTTKVRPKILKIVDEVYANKRPLIDAAPSRLYKATYGKSYIMGKSNMGVISRVLDESEKYNKMRSKINSVVGRVGAGNEPFGKVKFKDYDKLLKSSTTFLRRPSNKLVEENILRDLLRHIDMGGKDFKLAPGNNSKFFKEIKIKDVNKGDILTLDRVKKLVAEGDPRFKEYTKVFEEVKNLKLAPYTHPLTGEKITLLEGLQKATNVDSPIHLQHEKGVKLSPLKNLSVSTYKGNIGAKMAQTAEELQTLGIRGTLPGRKTVMGIPKLTLEENINRLSKWSDRMIEGAGTRVTKTPTETLQSIRPVLDIFNKSLTTSQKNRTAIALGCVSAAEGGRIGYALGSGTINCVNQKLTNEPVQSSMKLKATEGIGKVRGAATNFLKLLGRGGLKAAPLAAVAAVGAAAEPLVKQFRNDDPSTYLSNPEQQKGMLLSTLEAERPQVDEEILKWQYPGQIAGAAAAVPGSKAVMRARKIKGMGTARAALGPVGKVLAGSFSPLGVAASLPIGIAAQVKGGSDVEDIATDPLNWVGPAFASAGSEMATKGVKNPLLLKALRLGMSPAALRVGSRFLGLPGLALTAGMWGYDKWKNRD